jgi:hypothetical protein
MIFRYPKTIGSYGLFYIVYLLNLRTLNPLLIMLSASMLLSTIQIFVSVSNQN